MANSKEPQVGMLPTLEQPGYFPDLHVFINVYIRILQEYLTKSGLGRKLG